MGKTLYERERETRQRVLLYESLDVIRPRRYGQITHLDVCSIYASTGLLPN